MKKFLAEFRACWSLMIEYRLSVFIWMVTIVLPLIMMAAWLTIAEKGPVGGYDQSRFVSYYLAALVVRNMTGTWFIYEMETDMRLGSLSFRLLKPMDPIVHYFSLALSSKPLRILVLGPACFVVTVFFPRLGWTVNPFNLFFFVAALAGALIILFLMQYTIGLTGFWITRSTSVHEGWFFMYSLASGYLVPLDLFPAGLQDVLLFLPFRYTMSFPVEILTQSPAAATILQGLLIQWIWAAAIYGLYRWTWRRGLRHYSAVGA